MCTRRSTSRFVEGFVELDQEICVGNPLDAETTLGPMARASFADLVREQTPEALRKGAKPHIEMKVTAGRGAARPISRRRC